MREWTDRSGKYKTMARLADVAGATVFLQRDDGQIKAVPFDRLSAADQSYVTEQCPVEQLFGKVVGTVDGDTITVLDATNTQHKIRLEGIDCARVESGLRFTGPQGARKRKSFKNLCAWIGMRRIVMAEYSATFS